MAYTPTELGIAATDQRPYGEGAAEIASARERAAAEQTTATARPRMSPRNRQAQNGEMNPGYMGTPPQDEPPQPSPAPGGRGARTTATEQQIQAAEELQRQKAEAPTPAPSQPRPDPARKLTDDLTADWDRRVRESDAQRTDLWNHVLGFVDSLRNLPSSQSMKEQSRRRPGESDEEYKARAAKALTDVAGPHAEAAGQGIGLIATPYTIIAQEAEVATVQADPNMAAQYRDMIDSLPEDQQAVPSVRAAAAHAVLDSTTARLLRALDDPHLNDNDKRAAFAVAGGLILMRVAEFGGPQAARQIARLGIKATTNALKPRTVAFALDRDTEEAQRLTAMSQRLRAIGANEDAAAADAEIARIQKRNGDLAKAVDEAKAAEAPPTDEISFGDEPPPATPEQKAAGAAKAKAQAPGGMRIGDAVVRKNPETGALERFDRKTGERLPDEPSTPGAAAPGQRGAEPPGAPPAERPPAAPPPIKPGEEPNIGINLDKVDAPDHVKELIRIEGLAHLSDITAQRRGVVPLETTFAIARNLGIDVPSLAQIRAGTAFNAEGAVSVFNAIVKTAEKRTALEEQIRAAGALATPDQEARWLATVYDQNTLQRVFAGGRAELGRGMRALRELSSGANSGQIKDTFAAALDAIGGRPNFDKLLQRLKDIQTNPHLTPIQREIAAMKFVGSLHKARFWDKINEIYINSILSNPYTHIGNVAGQTALFEADTIAQLPAALFDAVVSGGGRLRPRTRTMQGAIVQAVAGHMALRRAVSEGLVFMREGVASEDISKFKDAAASRVFQGDALSNVPITDLRTGAKVSIPVGTAIRLPTRALAAEDVVFNRLGYQRQLWQDAANYVARDGKDSIFGRGFWRRVADVVDHPEDFVMDGTSMHARATEAGRRAGLRQDGGELARLLTRVRDLEIPKTGGLAPMRFVTPFVRIGFNLARVGAEYSPLGFIRVATTRGGTQADAFGRAVVGSSLWWFFWGKADMGELTGAAPTDAKSRADFYDSGKRPYAIKVGDRWIEYGRYEPIATTLKWIHGMREASKDVSDGLHDPRLFGSALAKGLGTMARSMSDSNYMSGLQDFYSIATASDAQVDEKVARFTGNLANSLMPYSGLRRFEAQREDPTLRHPTGFVEQIEASTPGLSQSVRPYLTHWGEPVQQPERPGGLYQQQEVNDPVDATLRSITGAAKLSVDGQELDPSQISVQLVSADISGFKLSKDEGFMLQQTAGRAAHAALADLFSNNRKVKTESGREKTWSEMDDREKRFAAGSVISEARRTARATVADAILLSATNEDETRRGVVMRLATISKVSDRAAFLVGLDRQGKLTPAVRRYLNDNRRSGERTVEEYLRAGRGL